MQFYFVLIIRFSPTFCRNSAVDGVLFISYGHTGAKYGPYVRAHKRVSKCTAVTYGRTKRVLFMTHVRRIYDVFMTQLSRFGPYLRVMGTDYQLQFKSLGELSSAWRLGDGSIRRPAHKFLLAPH